MKTLVLIPTNPVTISEAAILAKIFENEHTMVLSPQFLALLQEMSTEKKYVPGVFSLMGALKDNPYKDKKKRKNIIYYGNIYKETRIKFDQIIMYDGLHADKDQDFDPYLKEACKILKIPVDKFYLPSDAVIEVPTMKHLIKLLNKFYVKNDKEEQ